MSILFATGLMSLPAMAGISAVIFAEKVLPRPRVIARTAGVALLGLAVAVAVHPALLGGLRSMSPAAHEPIKVQEPMTTNMKMGMGRQVAGRG